MSFFHLQLGASFPPPLSPEKKNAHCGGKNSTEFQTYSAIILFKNIQFLTTSMAAICSKDSPPFPPPPIRSSDEQGSSFPSSALFK